MEIIFALLASLLILILVMVLSAVSVNARAYKYYSQVYNSLQLANFYRNGDQVYIVKYPDLPDFVYFIDDGSVRLTRYGYVHIFSGFMTYFDPYTYYWLKKYNRFMKHKLEMGLIEKY